MPFRLVDPRPGKTPYYYIRGTEYGVSLNETTGKTVKAEAFKVLKSKRDGAKCGELQSRAALRKAPMFTDAALSYIENCGDARFLGKFDEETKEWSKGLIKHFIDTKLAEIGQAEIDAAAVALYPDATPATRNRQVYTPVSAILKHAGIEKAIRRPKGANGKVKNDWMRQEPAFRLLEAAEAVDAEFGIFCTFLCYTGCRLSDALDLTTDRLILAESFVYFEETKNDDPRGAFLPPYLVAALANHPRGLERSGKVFRFRKNGRLYNLMRKAKKAAGEDLAAVTFHTFCHTWASWMRRYAKSDTRGLVGTTRWRDQKSAARYEHVVATEESQRAALLPTPKRKKNEVHGFSTGPRAELRLRSPKNAG